MSYSYCWNMRIFQFSLSNIVSLIFYMFLFIIFFVIACFYTHSEVPFPSDPSDLWLSPRRCWCCLVRFLSFLWVFSLPFCLSSLLAFPFLFQSSCWWCLDVTCPSQVNKQASYARVSYKFTCKFTYASLRLGAYCSPVSPRHARCSGLCKDMSFTLFRLQR